MGVVYQARLRVCSLNRSASLKSKITCKLKNRIQVLRFASFDITFTRLGFENAF